jgi:hypothetical protein
MKEKCMIDSTIWRNLWNNLGLLLFLAVDILFLFGYAVAKLSGKSITKTLRIQTVLVIAHLILGVLALWFDNHDAYIVVTVACWGGLVLSTLVGSKRDRGSDEALPKSEATDEQ